jgi:hypothetical protein
MQIADEFWLVNTINVQEPTETPETNYNLTNQTEDTSLINQIKELNYLETPFIIIIIAITAIFNLKFRKK